MDVLSEYRSKLKTPDEAVKCIKSGDWIDYSVAIGFPQLLDEALAKRTEELTDVKIRGNLIFGPIKTVEADPNREHFVYNSWHLSGYERKLADRGLCNYIPMIFRLLGQYYFHFCDVNVAMMAVPPMDKHGYFNLSCSTGVAKAILDKADVIILEINENLPKVRGGFDEVIHINEIDMIVEGEHGPLPGMPVKEPSPEDVKIAEYIAERIPSGGVIQLGIGKMPNTVGKLLADSDLKDLGMHTELCTDAYVDLYEAGKLTNKANTMHKGKGMTGIAFGTQRLYDWIDENPGVAFAPLEYVNSPGIIERLDNMMSINNCLAVDLYGQVCAESVGLRQISGTGGQLDYLTGASSSKGGKAFICMTSTFIDHEGKRQSRIKPFFNGDIVTDPRSQTYLLVTEYGVVNLVGRTTWERAEMLIGLAHPDFRDELIKDAEAQGIWRHSNRR